MFGTRKLFLSLNEEKRNGGNRYVALAPQTDAEQNHLEHAHHTGMGLGRGRGEMECAFLGSRAHSAEECFSSAKETLRDGLWWAMGQRLESG